MGDDEGGGSGRAQCVDRAFAQLAAEAPVEAGEGFVQQHDGGFGGEGAGQRDTLLLAAGELVRIGLGPVAQFRRVELGLGAGVLVRTGEPEGDIGQRRHVREEGIVLEHHADPARFRRDMGGGVIPARVAKADRTRLQTLQSGDGAQEGGFAAA